MNWNEFKTEVEKQMVEKGISQEARIDLIDVDGFYISMMNVSCNNDGIDIT